MSGSEKTLTWYDTQHVFLNKVNAERMLRIYKEFAQSMTVKKLIDYFEVQIKKDETWVTKYKFTTRSHLEDLSYFDRDKFLSIVKNNEYRVYAHFMNSNTQEVQIKIEQSEAPEYTYGSPSLYLVMKVYEKKEIAPEPETETVAHPMILTSTEAVNDKSENQKDELLADIDAMLENIDSFNAVQSNNEVIAESAPEVVSESNNVLLPPIELPIYK